MAVQATKEKDNLSLSRDDLLAKIDSVIDDCDSIESQVETIMILSKHLLHKVGQMQYSDSRRFREERILDVKQQNENTKQSWATAIKLGGATIMIAGGAAQLGPLTESVRASINLGSQGISSGLNTIAEYPEKSTQSKNQICMLQASLHQEASSQASQRHQQNKQSGSTLLSDLKSLQEKRHQVLRVMFQARG